MIPHHTNDWFARGAILLDLDSELPHIDSETIQIAIGVSAEIEKWGEGIIPGIYIPDGMTESPANLHGRVIIVVYKWGQVRHLRLGSIIFENGSANVNINNQVIDEHAPPGGEENFGSFDLSDPDFPATIFQPFKHQMIIAKRTGIL